MWGKIPNFTSFAKLTSLKKESDKTNADGLSSDYNLAALTVALYAKLN